MGDQNVKYTIDYSAPPGKINRDIDTISAKLTALGKLSDQVAGKLKSLGQNSPGLTKYRGELIRLDAELKTKVKDADSAERALRDVGKGNRSIADMSKRLAELESRLAGVTAAASGAQAGLTGVGSGAAGVGGGGGGKGTGKASAAGGGGNRLLNAAIAHTAIGMGSRAVTAVGRAYGAADKEHREFLTESAEKTAAFREELTEYASLRLQPGPNNKIVREAIQFSKDAGVMPEDIAPYLTTYEGSATTGRDKGNIGGKVGENGFTRARQEALEAKLKVRGAKFAMRTGLDAHTAGDLTGTVSTYAKITSEADLAGQLGGMHYGLDQGRGEVTPLARSELGQAGNSIKSGRVSGLPELGAFIGVASVASKTAGSAGTTYGQVSRFLNESGGDGEEQKQFIQESGIGAAKGDFNKLKALRDYLAKVKPEDANTFLESKGYGNSTDRRSVLGMVDNVDVLEQRIAKANQIAADGRSIIARDEANANQLAAGNRQGAASMFASQIEVGIGAEKLEQGRSRATARMMDPARPGGQTLKARGLTVATDVLWKAGNFGAETGEQHRVDEEAVRALIQGGSQVGVDVAKRYPRLKDVVEPFAVQPNPEQFAYLYQRAAYDVEQAGGDPFGGSPKDAAKALRNAAAALDRLDAGQGQAQGMRQAPPAPGNGGAGVNPGRR